MGVSFLAQNFDWLVLVYISIVVIPISMYHITTIIDYISTNLYGGGKTRLPMDCHTCLLYIQLSI